MLVLILTVFLGIILLRIIKNDFTRYMDGDEVGLLPVGLAVVVAFSCWCWAVRRAEAPAFLEHWSLVLESLFFYEGAHAYITR